LQRPIERRFNRDIIGKLDLHQIVWWDEIHRKCLIGGLSATKDYVLQFKRDKNDKIDFENGKYSDKIITKLNVKYEKECRLGLGCAMISPKG